jgi:hypothetical protein
VAQLYNVAPITVYLIKKLKSFEEKPRRGRPKIYSGEDFIRYIKEYPTKSPQQRHDICKKNEGDNAPSNRTNPIELLHTINESNISLLILKKKEWMQQKNTLEKQKKRSVLFYDEISTFHQLETKRYY